MKPTNVRLRDDGRAVVIQDQTVLPSQTLFLELETPETMHEAIHALRVRGAPAIGIMAAYSYAVMANRSEEKDADSLLESLSSFADYLNSSRPTAVNLSWALARMEKVAAEHAGDSVDQIKKALTAEATLIQEEDVSMSSHRHNGLP